MKLNNKETQQNAILQYGKENLLYLEVFRLPLKNQNQKERLKSLHAQIDKLFEEFGWSKEGFPK